jgi:hypothetical protein
MKAMCTFPPDEMRKACWPQHGNHEDRFLQRVNARFEKSAASDAEEAGLFFLNRETGCCRKVFSNVLSSQMRSGF